MLHLQQARATTSTNPPPPSNAELREQIRNSIQDAQGAARDAAQAGRDAARAARDAAISAQPVVAPVPPVPPGGTYTTQPDFNNAIPPQAVDMAIGFFIMCAVMVIGWPLARAFGRRIERKADVPAITPALTDQLQRIEQAVDAMSIEIERISESQRFMAKLQNAQAPERGALPADRR